MLYGGSNFDLHTNAGTDWMTGGLGADTFVFVSGDAEPGALARDHITDFSRTQGDKIDLRAYLTPMRRRAAESTKITRSPGLARSAAPTPSRQGSWAT